MSNIEFKRKLLLEHQLAQKNHLMESSTYQDYTKIFKNILTGVNVVSLIDPKDIFNQYKEHICEKTLNLLY